jgi:hypothetical protein
MEFSESKYSVPSWRKFWTAVKIAEGALVENDFMVFNVCNKDTVHEMVLMFEKLDSSDAECEVSQVDTEERIDEGKGIEVSCTTANGDLINAVMNTGSENETLENEFSDKESITEKISWAKAVDAYYTLLKLVKSQPCYLAQEVMQLQFLHSNFLQQQNQCTKQADICQIFQKALKSHMHLHL